MGYKIRVERPLIFLCGPYFQDTKKDRRNIILKYINSIEEKNNIKPIPFIVDKIFDKKIMEERSLNLPLSEEIVANVSFSTYIFLDTLSASMELGLFSNNNQNNKIKILHPEKRKTPSIGEFIKESIKSRKDVIETWKYEEKDPKEKMIFFKNDKLPKELEENINENIKDLVENELEKEVVFILRNEKEYYDFNEVIYSIKDKKLNFHLNTKFLFYLLLTNEEVKKIDFATKKINDEYLNNIIEFLKEKTFEMFIRYNDKYCPLKSKIILSGDLKYISLKTNLGKTFKDTLNHILNIIQIITLETMKTKGKQLLARPSYLPIFLPLYTKAQYNNIFNITEEDNKVIDSYLKNQNKYIYKFYITMNQRKKIIETYKDNKYGRSLRKLHNKINNFLKNIPLNKNVTAYKEGVSIKDSILKHKESNSFIKLDIKSYFNSIKFSIFKNIIKEKINSNRFNIDVIDQENKKQLKTLFFKNKLPIGFITSPVISNIYLYKFDDKISKKIKENNIIYTRYSDDILISRKTRDNLQKFDIKLNCIKSSLKNKLKEYKLDINTKKSKHVIFNKKGDYIRYLGINIVRDENYNKVTISNSYLRNSVKEYFKYGKNHSKVLGKENYIKNISKESYEKYLKTLKVWKYNRW